METFLTMSLRPACFITEAFFLVQGETSGLGTSLLKCQIIRISEISDIGLKAFCCPWLSGNVRSRIQLRMETNLCVWQQIIIKASQYGTHGQ